MPILHISVYEKIASYQKRDGDIVCGNSDYLIEFTFDDEWEDYPTKTARFIWNGKYYDSEFTGNTCAVPIIKDAELLEVGVFAGDLQTTTRAQIDCKSSILCGNTVPVDDEEADAEYASAAKEYASQASKSASDAAKSASEAKRSADSIVIPSALPNPHALTINGTAYDDSKAVNVTVQGGGGMPGEDGATFTPSVSSSGVISWTNDKGLANPAPVNIKGKDGTDGKDGVNGKDGSSYMSPPLFANSIEECADTSKLYVLPDGYIYAYKSVTESVKAYTNLAKTLTNGKRYNSSGNLVDADACACEDYIPFGSGAVVRVRGLGNLTTQNAMVYSPTKTLYATSKVGSDTTYSTHSYDATTDTITLTSKGDTKVGFLRIVGVLSGSIDDVIITVNEEIKESTQTVTKWANTGHAFVPADYEDRIIALEDDVISLQNEIASGGSSSSDVVTVPTYWESMIENKTETVKALQTEGGIDCVSFAYASDTHIPDNDNGRTNDIGKVMAKMLDNCDIPFAVITGDIATRASFSTEEEYVTAHSKVKEHLAPLWGTDRLLPVLGNHDGCYGDSSGYYRKQFSPERMWQSYFRSHALDFRRVFSEDGLYYYVDNIPQKMRYIILNSQYAGEYAVDSNGFAVNNRFSTSCYGQEQLDWLCEKALDMPEGYGAIIATHVPLNVAYTVDKAQIVGIINAYNGKKSFTGSYTGGVSGWSNSSISVNFSGAKGEIIAVFTGHVHGDSIDATSLSCPLFTILSAGASANEPYAESVPKRTKGTDTETSFDIVTINRKTRTIYCTRIGAGSDRSVTY